MAARILAALPPALALVAVVPAWAGGPGPGAVFQDCPACPQMVVIPPGRFVMGSSLAEDGRDRDENPEHEVAIGYPFAVSRTEVTRAQYRAFMHEAAHAPAPGNCWYWDAKGRGVRNDDASIGWQDPGYPQDDDHPVVCVSWHDAKAYAQWLSRKSGRSYRLLTETEWEYAARAGSGAPRPWGEDPARACEHANVGDRARDRIVPDAHGNYWRPAHDCDDGYGYTAPVGRYQPNRFGLHDVIGNVWEWTEDCANPHYVGKPADGSAWLEGDCGRREGRGGSWYHTPRHARSANRHRVPAAMRMMDLGFRVGAEVSAGPLSPAARPGPSSP